MKSQSLQVKSFYTSGFEFVIMIFYPLDIWNFGIVYTFFVVLDSGAAFEAFVFLQQSRKLELQAHST